MSDDVDAEIQSVLKRFRTVAVVGASEDPDRPSNRVARFLKEHGYHIVPVTPEADTVLGERAYPDLASIPEPVEIVDIFRRPEYVPPVVEEAIAIRAKAVWMQEGIVNEAAAVTARQAGLTVIMDRCMRKELIRLLRHEEA